MLAPFCSIVTSTRVNSPPGASTFISSELPGPMTLSGLLSEIAGPTARPAQNHAPQRTTAARTTSAVRNRSTRNSTGSWVAGGGLRRTQLDATGCIRHDPSLRPPIKFRLEVQLSADLRETRGEDGRRRQPRAADNECLVVAQ